MSTCLSLHFLSQCTPIIGHGFVLDKYKCQCRRGFFHPSRVALNGFKSRLQTPLWYKNTYCSELSDQKLEFFKRKLLGFMKKTKNIIFFQLTATHFVWKSSYVFEWVSWGLWGYETSSFSQRILTVLIVKRFTILFLFWALVAATGGFWIPDLLDYRVAV